MEEIQKNRPQETEQREISRQAFRMAWPSVTESVFISLAGIIDSLMVSAIGAYGVAAVGLTTQPKFIGMAPFIALSVAVSALVARRRGEGDREGANEVLLLALLLAVSMVAVVSVVSVTFADAIIRFAGSEADTHDSAVLYYRIIMGCFAFQAISMTINAAQRGSGNTKIAMRTNVTSNVTNMIGNYLIITGRFGFPAWGIRGAAIATVFGTVVACFMSVRSVLHADSFVSLPYIWKHQLKPRLDALEHMVKIAGSVFLEQVLMRAGFMAVAIMAAKQGTAAMAAHQVGMNIMSLSFSFGDGLQAAAVALIGQSLGQGREELARRYGRTCQHMGLRIAVVLSIVYLVGGRFIFSLYFEEAEIVTIGAQIMRAIAVILFFQITQVVYMGCLRGAGDVFFTTCASTFSVTIIRPIACYLLCYTAGLGLIGLWIGIGFDQLSRFALSYLRFRAGKWTKIKI